MSKRARGARGDDDRKRRRNNDGAHANDPTELMDGGYSLAGLMATEFQEGLTPKELGEAIAKALGETASDTVVKICEAVGEKKSLEIFEETKKAEEAGGIKVADGSRRRTPGGVFILLFKSDADVEPSVKGAIFDDFKLRKVIKARRRSNKLTAPATSSPISFHGRARWFGRRIGLYDWVPVIVNFDLLGVSSLSLEPIGNADARITVEEIFIPVCSMDRDGSVVVVLRYTKPGSDGVERVELSVEDELLELFLNRIVRLSIQKGNIGELPVAVECKFYSVAAPTTGVWTGEEEFMQPFNDSEMALLKSKRQMIMEAWARAHTIESSPGGQESIANSTRFALPPDNSQVLIVTRPSTMAAKPAFFPVDVGTSQSSDDVNLDE